MTDRLPIVMLVDDEEILGRAMRRALRLALGGRVEVETFSAPLDALARIDEILQMPEACVIVVSDGNMPGMQGSDFLPAAKAKLGEHLLGACMVSDDPAECGKASAQGFQTLGKPFESDELIALVTSFLPSP